MGWAAERCAKESQRVDFASPKFNACLSYYTPEYTDFASADRCARMGRNIDFRDPQLRKCIKNYQRAYGYTASTAADTCLSDKKIDTERTDRIFLTCVQLKLENGIFTTEEAKAVCALY